MNNPADTAEPLPQQEGVNQTAADVAPGADGGSPHGDGDSTKDTILEMRQVAGLTAGSVMGLHQGSFQFRESDKEVGFSLTVDGVDDVTVVAGSAATLVDEIQVDQPTPLGDAVLNVGSACFTVRPIREPATAEGRLAHLVEARTPPKAISVPEFTAEPAAEVQTRSSRFGSLFSKTVEESEATLDQQSWRFLESIRDVRSLVAERHRHLHPNPEELRSRLERLDPGLWDRTVDHPLFARFAVAYSTIPWDPRFDDPDRIPVELHRPIREMSCLPWVPITANLLNGPLGIVGSRPAVLACARNAVLSLASLSAPTDIEFSIVTAQGLVSDWDWTSSLPNSLFPTDEANYCIAVADGMTHFDGAGLDPEAVKENEMGLIVLEETVEDLPDYCGTILEITAEGQCQVTNHLGEQIVGTPIGVAAGFTSAAASLIRMAVGDGPDDGDDLEPDQADSESVKGDDGEARVETATLTGVGTDQTTETDGADRAKAIIDDVLAGDDEAEDDSATSSADSADGTDGTDNTDSTDNPAGHTNGGADSDADADVHDPASRSANVTGQPT